MCTHTHTDFLTYRHTHKGLEQSLLGNIRHPGRKEDRLFPHLDSTDTSDVGLKIAPTFKRSNSESTASPSARPGCLRPHVQTLRHPRQDNPLSLTPELKSVWVGKLFRPVKKSHKCLVRQAELFHPNKQTKWFPGGTRVALPLWRRSEAM